MISHRNWNWKISMMIAKDIKVKVWRQCSKWKNNWSIRPRWPLACTVGAGWRDPGFDSRQDQFEKWNFLSKLLLICVFRVVPQKEFLCSGSHHRKSLCLTQILYLSERSKYLDQNTFCFPKKFNFINKNKTLRLHYCRCQMTASLREVRGRASSTWMVFWSSWAPLANTSCCYCCCWPSATHSSQCATTITCSPP